MFRKLIGALLFGGLLAACRSEEDSAKIFVTDVEIVQSEVFAPGDPVTVRASGFEAGDRLLFDIRFPLDGELLPEGYARGIRAVERERTEYSITVLAPGGYPASTVGLLLLRGGEVQELGTVRVSDGTPPAESRLYGLADEAGGTCIERLDLATGCVVDRRLVEGVALLRCPVNEYGANRIYALAERDGGCAGLLYDLTMRYRELSEQSYVAVGTVLATAAYLVHDSGRLRLEACGATRASQPVRPVGWTLPEGLTAGMLSGAPFVYSAPCGSLLLAADCGGGTFRPVVLTLSSGNCKVQVGEPVGAGALIPFAMPLSREIDGRTQTVLAGGFAVSKPGGGVSELRLFDGVSMRFSEPFATLDDAVCSVAVDLDGVDRSICLLTEDGQGARRIRIYDRRQGAWRADALGDGLPYRSIVLAR